MYDFLRIMLALEQDAYVLIDRKYTIAEALSI